MRMRAVGVVLAMGLAGAPAAAYAQLDAKTQLANVEKRYRGTRTFSASFVQRYTNNAFPTRPKRGRVYVVRSGKMRWDYAGKNGKPRTSYVFDGKRVWMVDHANRQYYTRRASSSSLPHAVAFLIGKGSLTKSFDVSVDTAKTYARAGHVVLLLRPKKASARYRELRLVVNAKSSRVVASVVTEANGNVNRIDFERPAIDGKIAAQTFYVNEKALLRAHFRRMKKP